MKISLLEHVSYLVLIYGKKKAGLVVPAVHARGAKTFP